MNIKNTTFLVLLLTVVVSAGCNGEKTPAGMPKIHPCQVQVTLNGTVEEGAVVHFMPDNGSEWFATGTTNRSGNATMATLSEFNGVAEGTYHVTILKAIDDPNWKPKQNFDGVMATDPGWTSIYDLQYASPVTTPLTCTIKPGKNNLTFDVKENSLLSK